MVGEGRLLGRRRQYDVRCAQEDYRNARFFPPLGAASDGRLVRLSNIADFGAA
jgi:hypothetical protein